MIQLKAVKEYVDRMTEFTGVDSEELIKRSDRLFSVAKYLKNIAVSFTISIPAPKTTLADKTDYDTWNDLSAYIDMDVNHYEAELIELAAYCVRQAEHAFDCAKEPRSW